MLRAVLQSLFRAAWVMAVISAGISLDATEMIPTPPRAITGSVRESSPENTRNVSGTAFKTSAIWEMFPLASFTAAMFGTSANIEPATLARLGEVANIAGVKEASGNMSQIAEVLNLVPERFLVFSGDDALTLPVIALGGVGIISVASNEIPREMAEMTRAALNNDWNTARTIHRKYLPLMQANFIESNPLPVKAVLAMMGKLEEIYRLPLLPMRRDTRSKLQKIAADSGLISRPAVQPAAATEFYVYENWAAGPHKAILHRASCGQCSSGKGRPTGHDPNHSRWHGPYSNLAEAREATHQMPGVLIRSECKCVG